MSSDAAVQETFQSSLDVRELFSWLEEVHPRLTCEGVHATLRADMNKMICLVMLLAMALVTPGYGQDEKLKPSELRQEQKYARKAAESWVKDEIDTRKKVIAQLRKVKDERSAEKAAKALGKMLESSAGEQTALGEVGEMTRPTGEAMEAEDKKREPLVSKQKKQISAELKRIEALELESPEWQEAQMLVEKMP